MKSRFLLLMLFATLASAGAMAQVTTVVTPAASDEPAATVTTTVQSPSGTTTTRVTTTQPQSVMAKSRDGTRIEMDSDGSVYKVYSDGARVAAEDGIHTMLDGTTIAVKDGKRIP